jgi:hypothetical protein
MAAPDLLAAALPVIDALEALGVAYHIGGSVASSAQGVARATLDVDIVAALQLQHARPLAQRLAGAFYVDEDMIREAIVHSSCFNVIHLETMLKVDLFVLSARPYDRQAFARRQPDTLEEAPDAREVFLCTPEDTVLNKLEWFRMGGEVSERQWRDVIGVLRVQQGHLDEHYLRRWAADLGLTDLLERALAEASRLP